MTFLRIRLHSITNRISKHSYLYSLFINAYLEIKSNCVFFSKILKIYDKSSDFFRVFFCVEMRHSTEHLHSISLRNLTYTEVLQRVIHIIHRVMHSHMSIALQLLHKFISLFSKARNAHFHLVFHCVICLHNSDFSTFHLLHKCMR